MAHESQVRYLDETGERDEGISAVVEANGFLFLSGFVAFDENLNVVGPGDMKKQLEYIYDIIESALALHGATLEHVVSEHIYTTDLQGLIELIPVRKARYAGYAYPATIAVEVRQLFHPECLVEIKATAVKPA